MFPNLRELAKVESSSKKFPMGNPKAYNPNDTDNRPKFGILQFGKWEFYTWAKLAKLEDPEFTCALGLVLTGHDRMMETRGGRLTFKGAFGKIFRHFVP